jgi:hypothetical protein
MSWLANESTAGIRVGANYLHTHFTNMSVIDPLPREVVQPVPAACNAIGPALPVDGYLRAITDTESLPTLVT